MTLHTRLFSVVALSLATCLQFGVPIASAQARSPAFQPSESRFVQQLYQQVIANQRMAEMARNQGHTRGVRELGTNVSRDLRHTREDLRLLARDKRVNLSDTLTAQNRKAVSRLSSAPGRSFDRTYVDTLLQQLPRTLQQSKEIAASTRDAELRTYLSKINPRIERVISEAQTARARL